MKKLTEKIKNDADIIINVNTENDIPLKGLPLNIAKGHMKATGWYGYTKAETNEKVLLIQS